MAESPGQIHWYSPDPRGVLPLAPRRWNHGLRAALGARAWELRVDTCFAEVLAGCAARPETWIDPIIAESYQVLHRLGYAHCLEVWWEDGLVGGLYGIHLGGAFFGESMFSQVSGASKVALCSLMEGLHEAGFSLLDTQWLTPHLEQFGGQAIPRARYLQLLESALQHPATFPTHFNIPPGGK